MVDFKTFLSYIKMWSLRIDISINITAFFWNAPYFLGYRLCWLRGWTVLYVSNVRVMSCCVTVKMFILWNVYINLRMRLLITSQLTVNQTDTASSSWIIDCCCYISYIWFPFSKVTGMHWGKQSVSLSIVVISWKCSTCYHWFTVCLYIDLFFLH